MTPGQAPRERTLFLIAVGFVLVMPPLVLVADHAAYVFGVPVFYAYIFTVWGGLIAAGALLARRLATGEAEAPPDGRD
ncbi:hypothetical protein ACM64Y_15685 [Novispirillum sp. DQ9]|uniref:hypothetical protein n=1 Tax=Novispirillum sp. DQ9 TaxID=3398612 RepID=UPI003C7DD507